MSERDKTFWDSQLSWEKERVEAVKIQTIENNSIILWVKAKELEKQNKILIEALKKAEKRFSHIENWHRDNITDEYFSDCQDIGMTPEAYLRDGKNEAREALKAVGVEL